MELREHERKVQAIARALQEAPPGLMSLSKGSVSHMLPLAHDARRQDRKLDVSGLTRILEVDPRARTCTAEAGASFEAVLRATLPHGLMPTLVPELRGITVGGAVSGCSVESMSHRLGGFHDGALSYELVTGDGRVLRASREAHADLFEMLHGSYGTLGVLTRVDFRLVPARPYVRLSYPRYRDFRTFHQALLTACLAGRCDFIDAISHAPDCHVLCLGELVDEAPYTHRYDGERIYYRSTRERSEDYLTLEDYFFRYDADCHWLTRKVPPLEWPWVRRLLGRWLLGSTRLLAMAGRLAPVLQRGGPDVVVDCFLPATRYPEFYEWYVRTFDHWPLWLVPYRIDRPYAFVADGFRPRMGEELFIDCAIYGAPDPAGDRYQLLEDKLFELGGLKALIARNGYSEARFWEIYDQPRYRRAKALTDPEGRFRDLYAKAHCRS